MGKFRWRGSSWLRDRRNSHEALLRVANAFTSCVPKLLRPARAMSIQHSERCSCVAKPIESVAVAASPPGSSPASAPCWTPSDRVVDGARITARR
jgi:hypothetical protein